MGSEEAYGCPTQLPSSGSLSPVATDSARSDDSGNDTVTTPDKGDGLLTASTASSSHSDSEDKGEGLLTASTASSSHSDSEEAVKVCQVFLVCCIMTSCSNVSRVFLWQLHTSLGTLACSALCMKT